MLNRRTSIVLVTLVLSLAIVPVAFASPAFRPAFQDPVDIPFDLSSLLVGTVSLAPIIFLLVELLKRVNWLKTGNQIIGAVLIMAVGGYGLQLLSQADPSLVPIFEAVLRFGQALLGILVPAGGAVLTHRISEKVNRPHG